MIKQIWIGYNLTLLLAILGLSSCATSSKNPTSSNLAYSRTQADQQEFGVSYIKNRGNQLSMVSHDVAIEVKLITPGFFGRALKVQVLNKSPHTNTVTLKFYESARKEFELADASVVVPANAIRNLEIEPPNDKRFTASTYAVFWWRPGNAPKQLAASYRIPFLDSTVIYICQSPDGPITTHKGYPEAIDMCVPVSTPVLAARDGLVIRMRNTSTEGGPDPKYADKANYVDVLHEDGTIAQYNHLLRNVTVSNGDIVKAGQKLGEVGLTGYTKGPHLHFQVFYYNRELERVLIDPVFYAKNGHPIPIHYGSRITTAGVQGTEKQSPRARQYKIPTVELVR